MRKRCASVAGLALLALTGCLRPSVGETPCVIRVGTYNIRQSEADAGTANDWELRKSDLVREMEKLGLDVFGMQEVLPPQAAFITNALPRYAMVGDFRGADRKSDEASPVCYRKDRFEAVDGGTFWLSETPDVPGVKGWGAGYPRVCTWALLRDRASGALLTFANTHTDNVSERARTEGMLLTIRRMRAFAPKGTPIVFTGDHNCCETEAPARAVSGLLTNALYASESPPKGPWRTFNGWAWQDSEYAVADALGLPPDARNAQTGGKENPPEKRYACGGQRIDYIYVSEGVRVLSCETHADSRPGKKLYPSDHFPLTSDLSLK